MWLRGSPPPVACVLRCVRRSVGGRKEPRVFLQGGKVNWRSRARRIEQVRTTYTAAAAALLDGRLALIEMALEPRPEDRSRSSNIEKLIEAAPPPPRDARRVVLRGTSRSVNAQRAMCDVQCAMCDVQCATCDVQCGAASTRKSFFSQACGVGPLASVRHAPPHLS